MKHPKFNYELFSIKEYLEWIKFLEASKKNKVKKKGGKKNDSKRNFN